MIKIHTPIRVLQVLNVMDFGGVESVVMNYFRHINREQIQFDFAVSQDSLLPQKDEIQKLDGKIYLLPSITHIIKYCCALKKIIQENNYEIVHCHMNTLNVVPLFAAYCAKTKVRICHNHTTAHRGEGKKTIMKYLLRSSCKWFATDYFACGESAARWMYGNKCFNNGRVYLMRNAIDVEKFRYNAAVRNRLRKQAGLTDKFVIGHIGRFVYQKNHTFLVDVFFEIYKRKPDAVLLLVGEGELEEIIKEKVKSLGIEQSVIFYGTTMDTSILYQVMDVFLFPSYYEGFGMAAVEAQCSGLYVVASEYIPKEAKITDLFQYSSLKYKSSNWAQDILNNCKNFHERDKAYLLVKEKGFSIHSEAGKLIEHYLKMI